VSRPLLVVVDYGMGNLLSVSKALSALGARTTVSGKRSALCRAHGLVLPGVGAFGEAVRRLKRLALWEPLKEWVAAGRPFLGICLGYQLLLEGSPEFGWTKGMGLVAGRVARFPRGLKVPHMGWNRLVVRKRGWLLAGLPSRPYAYFVHSFYPRPADRSIVAAETDYGVRLASAVEFGKVAGVQFHPEKSQAVGLRILRNFVALCVRGTPQYGKQFHGPILRAGNAP